jgi:hypothetical protein
MMTMEMPITAEELEAYPKLNQGDPVSLGKVDEALRRAGFGTIERHAIFLVLHGSPELEKLDSMSESPSHQD